MTVCPVLECCNNDRQDMPRCKLAEIEVDDTCRCLSFEADHSYLRNDFRERKGYLVNLEKAHLWDRSQPPVAVRAEALHDAARKFLVREENPS